MLASCFQRIFGVIRHVEFTFQQICGGTVCNLRFFSYCLTSICFTNLAGMPNKCAVFGCKSGYSSSQIKPLFHIPGDEYKSLKELWVKFLNRENYTITTQTCICIDHFEEKYIVRNPK